MLIVNTEISQLLDDARSLRPNIPQDSMSFHEFPLAENMHFHQVPSNSMKFQQRQTCNSCLEAERNGADKIGLKKE